MFSSYLLEIISNFKRKRVGGYVWHFANLKQSHKGMFLRKIKWFYSIELLAGQSTALGACLSTHRTLPPLHPHPMNSRAIPYRELTTLQVHVLGLEPLRPSTYREKCPLFQSALGCWLKIPFMIHTNSQRQSPMKTKQNTKQTKNNERSILVHQL